MVAALLPGHRVDDRLDALQLVLGAAEVGAARTASSRRGSCRAARSPSPSSSRRGAARGSPRGRTRSCLSFFWSASACVAVVGLLGALDQRQHVAHAEDARRDAVGMERLERVELLAGAGEEDRLAGDGAQRQRGAAARVALDLGEDRRPTSGRRARKPCAVATASWPVMASATSRIWRGSTAARMRSSSAISSSSTVWRPAVSMSTVSAPCARGGGDAVCARCATGSAAGGAGVHAARSICRPRVRELLDGGGTVDVGGDQVRPPPALVAQVARELGGGGRLAGAVQADQHDDDRRRAAEVERDAACSPSSADQLAMHELDEVLLGREAAQHLLRRARPS